MNDESREKLRESILESLGKSFPEVDKFIVGSTSKYPYECPYKFIDVNTLTRDDEVIEEVLQSYEKEAESFVRAEELAALVGSTPISDAVIDALIKMGKEGDIDDSGK